MSGSLGGLDRRCALLLLGAGLRLRSAPQAAPAERPLYHDPRATRPGYPGPGREEPEPGGLREVAFGYFGPPLPEHPDGGLMWLGTSLAVEDANRDGGYRGLPFRLLPRWSENPWAGGASQVVKMAYEDKVWAIIGSVDGAATHLAEQVVAKALVTLVNPAATDKSIHRAGVPWMFSLIAGDQSLAPVVVRALYGRTDAKPCGLVAATDHDSRAYLAELKRAMAEHRPAPLFQVDFDVGRPDLDGLVERIVSSRAQSLLLAAGAGDSARLVKALRGAGFRAPVFGGPWLGRRRFLEAAGDGIGEVFFPMSETPSTSLETFERRFAARFGRPSDYTAAHGYDAARLLIAAVRKGGLNRARIRDAMEALAPWGGVTGVVDWDNYGQNARRPVLATIRGARPCQV